MTRKEAIEKIEKIKELVTRENRKMTADERRVVESCLAIIESIDADGKRAVDGDIDRVDPSDPTRGGGSDVATRRVDGPAGFHYRSADQDKRYAALWPAAADRREWNDKNISFFGAVLSGRHHPDLTARTMSEGTPADGGYLVPVEWARTIHDVSLESEIVQPRSSVVPMSSNELNLPAWVIGDHSSSLFGGFTASYKAEQATLTEADPKTRNMLLHAYKLTGLIKGSNELAADMIGGPDEIARICGQGLAWYRDKAFLKGTGAGEPLGILNGSCLVEVSKEDGQVASTITYQNLADMLARLWAGSFKRAVWVCHQSTIPQLLTLSVAVGTGGSHYPVLSEAGGQWKMLTRPVIFTEKVEVLGQKGDIMLADFSQYVIGLRQGMRFDVSQHAAFTTDEFYARLIERHDGQPLWNEALTLADGSTTVSPFVTLAERS